MSLYVVVREDFDGSRAARLLDVAARGAFADDGSLRLEIGRATFERRDRDGRVAVVTTDVVAARPSDRTGADESATRLLESLRAASVRIGLHPQDGVVSVEGIDRAFDAAVARDPSLAAERSALFDICSDDGWRRGLAAAGLSAVPSAALGPAERVARVRVPGLGATTMRLTGDAGSDSSGLRAVRVEGGLAAGASFAGDAGASPPPELGAAVPAGVAGSATTSYPHESGPPVKGEWTLTTPFTGGVTQRVTTTFTLVLR